jgi:hypothetical protein
MDTVSFACGVTTTDAAYCWGNGRLSQLGSAATSSLVPIPVSGGLGFSSLFAGEFHVCGLATTGTAHCWGQGESGELGDGAPPPWRKSSVPVAVSGGLSFTQLSGAVGRHTCALTAPGIAWCWGDGRFGQLGNASLANSNVPLKVPGQP